MTWRFLFDSSWVGWNWWNLFSLYSSAVTGPFWSFLSRKNILSHCSAVSIVYQGIAVSEHKKQVEAKHIIKGTVPTSFILTFISTVWNGHSHIFTTIIVLRFGWWSGEAADAWFRRRAEGGHAVCRVIGTCSHLVRWAVGDETLRDGELGMLQVLLQLGVLVGPRQLLVGGRGALCRDHAVATLIWK